MAPSIPTRCSPRSLELVCNGLSIQELTTEQTSTLLALAHYTGWSADCISIKIQEITGVKLTAEAVWDIYLAWVCGRGEEELSKDATGTMQVLLNRAGVSTSNVGPPLSRTYRPQSVKFTGSWIRMSGSPTPLFPGFTLQARELSREYLFITETSSGYSKMTPVEEELSAQFGPIMVIILKDVLKRWTRAMISELREEPSLRSRRQKEYNLLNLNHLEVFEHEYASKFGKMEEQIEAGEGRPMQIRSTACCAKIFLRHIMADRLQIADRRRQQRWQEIGFVKMDVSMLADDSKSCPICLDPMGDEVREGVKEVPIKLITCCSQVIGHQCLKVWLCQYMNKDDFRNSCPLCRFNFPGTFLENLFSTEEQLARLIRRDDQISNRMVPSPAPSA